MRWLLNTPLLIPSGSLRGAMQQQYPRTFPPFPSPFPSPSPLPHPSHLSAMRW